MENSSICLKNGIRDGVPIALGYFAVAFTLGIAARNAGFAAVQAAVSSLLNHASAGEYAVITLAAAGASCWEMAVMALVTNVRYLLMSCSLSQKLAPETPMLHRLLLGYCVTDEIFAISIAYPGRLSPWYTYGATLTAVPSWAAGMFFGVVLGNILPLRAVSALSVGLYGMFLAIIVAPMRKSRVMQGLVLLSFAASYLANRWSVLASVSSGMKTIFLTVVIALAAALLFPVEDEEKEGKA